jgi:3-(3-hydroxy-phenyl)propionate hydroxylase
MAPDADPAYVSRPDVARERVAAMLGRDVDFELVWVGAYSYRTMLMERFCHGRLVFIGDAAHAKSPFGARGGNSGIADADNLGWKLALLLSGRAGREILQTYHLERHRAAEENVRITSRSGRFMQPRSKMEHTLRTAVLQLAHEQHVFARSLLNTGRMMAPHHYAGLPTVGPRAEDGKLVPNVPLRRAQGESSLVEVLCDAGGDLVAFVFPCGDAALDDARPDLSALSSALADLPAKLLLVGRDVQDSAGLLAAQTATPPGGIALLRPDAHLAAGLASHDAAALRAAVLRTLGRTESVGEQSHASRHLVAETV